MFRESFSDKRVGTREFADAVIQRLGNRPERIESLTYRPGGIQIQSQPIAQKKQALVGVDVFLVWDEGDRDPTVLGERIEQMDAAPLTLKSITNRGVVVYPGNASETSRSDMWRLRYLGDAIQFTDILALQQSIHQAGFHISQVENLYTFDGERGYSLGQGE
jgi:isocitrate dehydrogenase